MVTMESDEAIADKARKAIYVDILDNIVRLELLDELYRIDSYGDKDRHIDDIEYDNELRPALVAVINYYSTHIQKVN